MTIRNGSRPIARVFRATAAPGCRDELLQRFHSSSAALVNWGALNILEPVDALAPEVAFESHLAGPRRGQGGVWRRVPASAALLAHKAHHLLIGRSLTERIGTVGHRHNQLSRRSARSICAVALSMSAALPVVAATRTSSAT